MKTRDRILAGTASFFVALAASAVLAFLCSTVLRDLPAPVRGICIVAIPYGLSVLTFEITLRRTPIRHDGHMRTAFVLLLPIVGIALGAWGVVTVLS